MPFYSVYHIESLTEEQQDALAEAITRIHSDKFSTPKIFVNILFHNIVGQPRYIGGKRRAATMIEGNLRHGPSRRPADYEAVIKQFCEAWRRIVPGSTLNRVVLNGSIVAGMEAGYMLPPAGGDADWLAENWDSFKTKAQAGDAEMQDLVHEVEARGLRKNGMTAAQRLEHELGWGDAA